MCSRNSADLARILRCPGKFFQVSWLNWEQTLRILMAHNYYQQRGGEDAVFEMESDLLERHGHQVIRVTDHNDRIRDTSAASAAMSVFWSKESAERVRRILQEKKVDVAHFHNTFPLLSPSVYAACKEAGVPVVQTLHNFRLFCPAGILLRNGSDCFKCIDKSFAYHGIIHACYRNSRVQTALSAASHSFHRNFGSIRNCVDRFIALSETSKQLFIRGGLPSEKIVVKPNWVHRVERGEHAGEFALFVGRLSAEKGVLTAVRAFERLPNFPLKIVGTGYLDGALRKETAEKGLHNISMLGDLPARDVRELMGKAKMLIFPSEWRENCPLVLLEALASNLPIIAAESETTLEILQQGSASQFYERGNTDHLVKAISAIWNSREELAAIAENGMRTYRKRHSPEASLDALEDLYRSLNSNLAIEKSD